jgi:Flp pilus assembly protein TadD
MATREQLAAAANDDAIQLLNRGDASGAAAGFRKALWLQPYAAESYFNLGIALKDQSRHHDSIVAYVAALKLRPAFPAAHFNVGRALQMLADDPGPAGYLRHHPARRQALLRAAHHFRRASNPAAAAPSDAVRSLEVTV